MGGIVYTETVIHSAAEAYQSEVPYQIAIVTLDDGSRVTGRVRGERVRIGDAVERLHDRAGVPQFQRILRD
jgi:uncharacterized OB-fold protein